MKSNKKSIVILSFLSLFVLLGTMTSCEEDRYAYNKLEDLFQPKFVLDEPLVQSNSIAIVWYEVNLSLIHI